MLGGKTEKSLPKRGRINLERPQRGGSMKLIPRNFRLCYSRTRERSIRSIHSWNHAPFPPLSSPRFVSRVRWSVAALSIQTERIIPCPVAAPDRSNRYKSKSRGRVERGGKIWFARNSVARSNEFQWRETVNAFQRFFSKVVSTKQSWNGCGENGGLTREGREKIGI